MKNQIQLTAGLALVAILLSFSSFPTQAEKSQRLGNSTKPLIPVQDKKANPQDTAPVVGRMSESRVQDPELGRHFTRYDLIRIDPDAAERQVRNRGRLSLQTSRGNFDMQFTPHDLRSPDYVAQEIGADGVARKLSRTPVNTFKGAVKGNPQAQARMSYGPEGIEGAIITAGEKYFIQPARAISKVAQADEYVFYSMDDVVETDHTCGVTLAEEVAAREGLAAEGTKVGGTSELNSPISPLSPMKVVRIATDADGEYVTGLGGSTQALNQINSIVNMVEAIYEVEAGITFQIVFQNTWPDQNTDPYTTTTPGGPDGLLAQFRNYWNSNFTSAPANTRSVAHLWTGRDLDGTTIGIASLGVVCRFPSSAYGLSQRFPFTGSTDARTVILTTHEIGHNLSAAHTNQPSTSVPVDFTIPCRNTIMESGLGVSTGSSFCPFSLSQIIGHATAYGSCLTNGAGVPTFPCTEVPIDGTLTANGTLSNTDCRSTQRGLPFFADQYSFNGVAGQRVSIRLIRTSGGLDPYLFLIGPDGFLVSQDDDGNGGNDSRIPSGSGTITLPTTGKYVLEATSFLGQQTGSYTISAMFSGCSLSVTPAGRHFSATGGNVTFHITGTGDCSESYLITTYPDSPSWLSPHFGGGTPIHFEIAPNSSTAGRRAFILIGPSQGDSSGGIMIPITQSGTGPNCSLTPISIGQSVNGNLAVSDCESGIKGLDSNGQGFRADRYTFGASAGQEVAITLTTPSPQDADDMDAFLTLLGPNGNVLLNDDDSGGGTNSKIPGGTGMLTLGVTGIYTIEVSSFGPNQLGNYTLSLTGTAGDWQPTVVSSNQVELRSWKFEGRSYVYVKLTFPDAGYRSNWGPLLRSDTDFSPATVVERFNGVSVQATKTSAQIFDLGPLPSGNYTFTLKNSGTTVKVLNFSVSSFPEPPNPIDEAREFVRWQYKDFLRREPDGPGWDHWTGEITECSDPTKRFPGEFELQCIERKRANTSAAFFLSPEFQNTGYFILRVYRGSLGRMPHFGGSTPADPLKDEFTRDAGTVSQGIVVNDKLAPAVINANKQAFVNEFVTRAEFRAIYDGLNNTEYVNRLFQTTGVTPTSTERQALINGLGNGTETRASVLFKVVDGTTTITDGHLVFNTTYGKAFYDNLFNAAFVQMEYFGYLLRDPDEGGYAFWLGKLNQFGNWVDAQMVLAFIKSPEYRSRFGAP